MNDQELLNLAERMVGMTDEESLEFLSTLSEMPKAEDLAKIQALVEDIKNAKEPAEEVAEKAEEPTANDAKKSVTEDEMHALAF